jgi:lipopolysaccharide transport system ATP-binding protein
MAEPAITVEKLGKRYALGRASSGGYRKFSDALLDNVMAPLNWVSRSFSNRPLASTMPHEHWALRDVSFEIQQGSVVGIIGRNGAGKSTLLKVLSRITEPTSGRVTLRGRVASLLEVGTGFHPELSGRENIYLNGAILGMTRKEIKAHFDEIVEFAGVEKFLDTPVKRYSSGMYVRLAFAIAAHLEPEILILDEVLAVGDAEFQKRCFGRMSAVASEGRTVLIVSHQMDVILRLAERALLFSDGQIVKDGSAAEVVRDYLAVHQRTVFEQIECGRPQISKVEFDEDRLRLGVLAGLIHYSSPAPVLQPSFAFAIHDVRGAPLFGASSLAQPSLGRPADTCRGVVEFVVDSLPLISGDYSLSVWFGDGTQELQKLPHVCAFSYQDPDPPAYPVDARILGSVKTHSFWSFKTEGVSLIP